MAITHAQLIKALQDATTSAQSVTDEDFARGQSTRELADALKVGTEAIRRILRILLKEDKIVVDQAKRTNFNGIGWYRVPVYRLKDE